MKIADIRMKLLQALQDEQKQVEAVGTADYFDNMDNYFYDMSKTQITDLKATDFITVLDRGYFTYKDCNIGGEEVRYDVTVYWDSLDTTNIMKMKMRIYDIAIKYSIDEIG